jgi:uncharacterized protein YjbJ (UPF0337 family)
MNKDQIKGSAKNTVGKLQRSAGKLVGSEKQQVKGIVKQVAGKTQQRYGDLKEAARVARKNAR